MYKGKDIKGFDNVKKKELQVLLFESVHLDFTLLHS